MKGDFSRLTFNPQKHYSGVLWQQGKVQLDAELNELQAIQHYRDTVEARDVIGWSGAPEKGGGFKIGVTYDREDLIIYPGRIYVDGRLCVAEATPTKIVDSPQWRPPREVEKLVLAESVLDGQRIEKGQWIEILVGDRFSKIVQITGVKNSEITFEPPFKPSDLSPNLVGGIPEVRRVYTYNHQPHFDPKDLPEIQGGKKYLVYLDVWERFISAIDDPEIRERALGGIETACRSKTVWQVKLIQVEENADCSDFGLDWKPSAESSGMLNVRTAPVPDLPNDCLLPPQAGYQGLENQLYRVEIHKGGQFGNGDEVTFKWSRDNGSVVTSVKGISGQVITVESVGPDDVRGFSDGQWVELVNDTKEFHRLPGQMSKITVNQSANTITFGLEPELKELPAKLRRWDGIGEQKVEIPQENDGWIKLENAIEIKFSEGSYTTGDYWIIPARAGMGSEIGGIEWPRVDKSNPLPQPPRGVRHHYAPLAVVKTDGNGKFVVSSRSDCRNRFLPLIDLVDAKPGCKTHCCTMTVGDGVLSRGDFNDLQEAVENMPDEGGSICVLPGTHHASVKLFDREDLHIKGCGTQSIIHPSPENPKWPIFSFSSCRNICLENLTLITFDGSAVEVNDAQEEDPTAGLLIERNHILALTHAIDIRVENQKAGNNSIRIRNNEIGIWDREDGDVAIFSNADDVVIEDNRIFVIPAVNPKDPSDTRDPDGPENKPFDLCEDPAIFYDMPAEIVKVAKTTLNYKKVALMSLRVVYKGKGGIQIAGGSENVRITGNQIVGGAGNGVTLGDLPALASLAKVLEGVPIVARLHDAQKEDLTASFQSYLYNITIENNTIKNMGLSGVGVAAFMHSEKIGLIIEVDNLKIRENTITSCANQVPEKIPQSMINEVGFGGVVLAACENVVISDNRIEDNGTHEGRPICGILILYGEKVDISGNRILNNGPSSTEIGERLEAGLRGGVVVTLAYRQVFHSIADAEKNIRRDGIPAAKIHDNIVVQPTGQALFLMALGPVSVVGNQFTSQGTILGTNLLSMFAAAVMITNLGRSQDLLGIMPHFGYRFLTALKIAPRELSESVYLPNGNVLFADNQTTLDTKIGGKNLVFSAQLIVSMDDVAYHGNQAECRHNFVPLLSDVSLLGVTIRANDNRFQEGNTNTSVSLFSVGLANITVNNQATNCVLAFGGAPQYIIETPNSVMKSQDCYKYHRFIGNFLAALAS